MTGRAADAILDALIARIVSGQLPPGDPLAEQALAEQFGVSRTPVREALHRLEHANLAVRGARRAFVVRGMKPEELCELFEAVGEVESALASLAAHRMSEIERCTLQAILEEGEACGEDPKAYGEVNARFHKTINDGAHNKVLAATLEELNTRTLPWREVNFTQDHRRLGSSRTEHREITEAIVVRNAEKTRCLMRSHVASSYSVAARILARRSS
ncbi:GntR family transcriptional regulator [Roseibium aggregatum]|uniref:Carbon starvation induced regulator n=1 Tax=Roseibium aggregatum TaxID=187304 RepID=A0A0M6YDT7_9HYPH|nr:GntR family transcriptional regulator [Roseibium aggregatum]CTQ47407.1 Carbon starvation induced regulator [Roseibium aggregatum]